MNATQLTQTPNMLGLYLKALTATGNPKSQTLPNVAFELLGVQPKSSQLNRYRNVCGFKNADYLPITFAHVMAFPLHMKLLIHPDFPYKAMGMVHLSNAIKQYRPIRAQEFLNIRCEYGGITDHDKGKLVEIKTLVHVGQELVWESSSFNLKLIKSTSSHTKSAIEPSNFIPHHEILLAVPSHLARDYAWVSGDINPFHLHTVLAKLMGHPKQFMHGMWSYARVAAEMESQINAKAVELDVKFKTPMYLPTKIGLHYQNSETGMDYKVSNVLNHKPHLEGSFKWL